jgi:hypothetical protein
MLETTKTHAAVTNFNESFELVKTEFCELTTEKLQGLKIQELTEASKELGELLGQATTLHCLELINIEDYSCEIIRMINIIDNHAKMKDLNILPDHKHLELNMVKESMIDQDHETLLTMSEKAESCTICKRTFIKAAVLTS